MSRESVGIENTFWRMRAERKPVRGGIPFPAKALVKGVIEDRRDKLRDIEMFIKKLEKGRGIV